MTLTDIVNKHLPAKRICIPDVYLTDTVAQSLRAHGNCLSFWELARLGSFKAMCMKVEIDRTTIGITDHVDVLRDMLAVAYPNIENLDDAFVAYGCTVGICDEEAIIIVPKACKVTINDGDDMQTADYHLKLFRAKRAYTPVLRKLARLTNRPVVLDLKVGGDIRAPLPVDGAIHLFPANRPPGVAINRYVSLVYGLPLMSNGKREVVVGHAKGRGIVKCDAKGVQTVQVLGDSWYLLLPIISVFYGRGSVAIFEDMLAQALEADREQRSDGAIVRPADEQTFIAHRASEAGWFAGGWDKQIEQHRRDIEDATVRLAAAQRNLRMAIEWATMVKATPFIAECNARAPLEFARLQGDPRVAKIMIVEGVLHIETKPIVIEHDGNRYDVGTFVIGIDRCSFTVWGLVPTHPDRVPHPHIDRDGIACFGNASQAITDAVAELRVADAVNFMLEWLEDGYEPSLARVKIETWPKITTEDAS